MNVLWHGKISVAVLFVLTALLGHSTTCRAESFELQDGDRVAFLGDALIEQEQYAGWIELMMTAAFPDRDVTFRNLGWSADTPSGIITMWLKSLASGA